MSVHRVTSKIDFQQALTHIRVNNDYDFAGIALPSQDGEQTVIKWQYASGNINTRYQRIVLRNGRGIAGTVMRVGKRMIIHDIQTEVDEVERIHYPIVISEQLTAIVAIPLWHHTSVEGVLLLGQRQGRPLTGEAPHYHLDAGVLGVYTDESK